MRDGSDELLGVLTGSFNHHYVADLYIDGDRRMENIPLDQVKFQEDGGARVQQSGSCTVVWQDEFGTSLTPAAPQDPLAPFGAQLWVWVVVELGSFSERVEYGHFEITDVPSARDEHMMFRSEWITAGSVVQLDLKELTAGIGEEKFPVPTAPTSLDSTWDEIGRITGLPLQRNLTDQTIPRSYAYAESKLDTLYDMFDVMLSGVPHMATDGSLMGRPNAWPASVMTLTRKDHIVAVGDMMSAADVYNDVVVTGSAGDQSVILARASIVDGPLRVANDDGTVSPFRRRTLIQSSELVTTSTQAAAWAQATLAQVSTLRTRVLPVTVIYNPLLERGDVVLIERPTEWWTCRIVTIDRGDATQDMTVQVGTVAQKTGPEWAFPKAPHRGWGSWMRLWGA